MNSRIRPSLVPRCSRCINDYIEAGLRQPVLRQQIRTAKSGKLPDTIPVQLLKDLDHFGKKGTFVPVPAGTMRNKWFPYHVARYLSFEERRDVKHGKIEVVRDYSFEVGAASARTPAAANSALDAAWKKYIREDAARTASTTSSQITVIEPERAASLLDVLLPDTLEFERRPVPKPQTESKSKLPASVQAMLKASMPEAPTAIFGSVSTQDIAQHIREAVAYNDEAAQIHLGEGNVKIVDPIEGDDATKVKHLGKYEVEISFKGADLVVRRSLAVVKPKESSIEESIDPSMPQDVTSETLEQR